MCYGSTKRTSNDYEIRKGKGGGGGKREGRNLTNGGNGLHAKGVNWSDDEENVLSNTEEGH